MTRQRPPNRIEVPRTTENEKRDLSANVPRDSDRVAVGTRAWYKGYGKHKRNPYIWNLAPYRGPAPDRTYCEDAGFTLADEPRIRGLLMRGIEAGLFGDLVSQGDPTMLWTIDDNGWIYEFRLTTPSQAEYHGYPMRTANAFSQKVIARYASWLDTLPAHRHRTEPQLRLALQTAVDRYT
jgi:hypothetical protein